jgi:uncharacterized membrane protein YqiK
MDNNTLGLLLSILPLLIRLGVVVMIVIITVTLVRILRVLKERKASGIQVVDDGGDGADGVMFAGVDPQVVAAIAATVAVMGQSEGKRLVVRSVRRSGGWADAGRRESAY